MVVVGVWLGVIATAIGIVGSLAAVMWRLFALFERRLGDLVDQRLEDHGLADLPERWERGGAEDRAALDDLRRAGARPRRGPPAPRLPVAGDGGPPDGPDRRRRAVADVRLGALEADMYLVKQHLIGTPAA